MACSIVSTSRTKFGQLSHLVAHLAQRCSLILLWLILAMTGPIIQRIADRFEALGFVDPGLSVECCDGIEEVTFERRAQNLCQLPDYTHFARWLFLVEQRSPSLESFAFFVGQDHLQRFPFAEENQRVIEVGRNTSQFTRVPVHEFLSQLSHRSFLSRSGSHCSDDFLYSSTLKPSCPGTEHPGPVSPRSVIAAEVLWLISRRKRFKSESRVVSLWCFWHLGPSESTPTTCCHCSLCSVQSFPPRSGQHSFCASRYCLACSAASSLFRCPSVNSITCWITAATCCSMVSATMGFLASLRWRLNNHAQSTHVQAWLRHHV